MISHRRLPRLALALLLPVAALLGASAPAPLPDIPPRPLAPNDTAEYRRLVLPNGLRVLLLSDAKLNKSSASLAVGAGSLSDPASRPGLAHFLEHMLFLGTKKFPDVSDYDNYLQTNGGFSNAYTADDRTNYHFEIRHEALEGALDRFAQFFIAPLFTPEFTEREINAVHAEHQKNLENDLWREQQVLVSLYRAGHPANRFSTGNRETLGGTTREELLAFYRAHYTASRMTLAVTSKASLDQLEQWVRRHFSEIENRPLPLLSFPADFLPPKPALRLARIEPVKDLRQLSLQFPLPATRHLYPSKPDALLGYLLGYEGPGSLLSQLKTEGLATALSAGAFSDAPDYGSFNLQITLTPAGLEKHQRVLQLVFAAIAQLRAAPYPSHLFRERQTLARLDETYRDQGEGAQRATTLANLLLDHPIEFAERVPFLWLKEDPASYQHLLSHLRPDNLLALLVAKGLPTDRTDPHYGTRYSYTEDTGPAYAALLSPPAVPSIRIPDPNPFLPTRATVRPAEPTLLIDEPTLALHHSQDTEFLRPMVASHYRFRLPRSLASLRTSVLLRFYEACVNEALNETTYPAREAGLNFSVTASLEGVTLSLDGYDQSADRLLDTIAANLLDFHLTDDRFLALKDRLLRSLANFPRSDAWQILQETRRALVREFHFTPDEQLPVARDITLADVRAFARQLYARGKLEALVHGNVTAPASSAAARRLASTLRHQPVPDADLLRRRLLVPGPAGDTLRTSEKLLVNNSAFRREFSLGSDTPETRAATLALASFLAEPVYSELRTRQQLGYIVFGGAGDEERSHFAYFIIQSADYPADQVEARADTFIATLPDLLKNLPADDWANIVAGVRARLQQKDKSIAERATRLFDLAYNRQRDWGRREATLAALDTLTQARAAELLAQALAPSTRRMLTLLAFARDHQPASPPQTSFTDRAAWKQTRAFD